MLPRFLAYWHFVFVFPSLSALSRRSHTRARLEWRSSECERVSVENSQATVGSDGLGWARLGSDGLISAVDLVGSWLFRGSSPIQLFGGSASVWFIERSPMCFNGFIASVSVILFIYIHADVCYV